MIPGSENDIREKHSFFTRHGDGISGVVRSGSPDEALIVFRQSLLIGKAAIDINVLSMTSRQRD